MVAFILGNSLRNMFVVQSEVHGSCNILTYQEDGALSLRVFPDAIRKGAWYRQGFKSEDAIANWLEANEWDWHGSAARVKGHFHISDWRRFWIEDRKCTKNDEGLYDHKIKLVWAVQKRRFTYTFTHPTRGFYDVLNTRWESCHISLNHAAHMQNIREEKAQRKAQEQAVTTSLSSHLPGC